MIDGWMMNGCMAECMDGWMIDAWMMGGRMDGWMEG